MIITCLRRPYLRLLRKGWRDFPESYRPSFFNKTCCLVRQIPTQPPALDSLPQYPADGVPDQADADLRALQDWIDDLLKYRQDVAAEDIDTGESESIEAIEESSGGTVVIKKVSCSKDDCKCQSGELQSSYEYIIRRQGDSLDWVQTSGL